jgi:alkaline phosphatase
MRFFKTLALVIIYSCGVLFSQNTQRPKNIIILIGDGMGANYVSAAVLNLPQNPFRKFNSVGFSITRAANKLVTDSAPAATAISTGYRTNSYCVGVDSLGNPLTNIFEEAETLNLSTGLVVTCTITHATPAAFVAHVFSRKEETSIAKQFLDKDIDVVIGGGAKYFNDPTASSSGINGFDILERKGYEIYKNADELFSGKPKNKFYALLENEHLKKAADRNYSLADLTTKALSLLSKNGNGFILMVEGSQIDWGAHENNPEYVLSELNDLCGAINAALDFADSDGNTLVVVTADHETGGMSINDGKPDGSEITMKYTTGGHSAEMVGVFAKGPGEELFRGVYDNYMIGRNLFQLLNPDFQFR